jgi:ectoine hydroxylase-related dioxygenase (phytanoyl-CoA dioxygenase family)
VLNREAVARFWSDGFLVVPEAVTSAQLAALRADVATWVGESRHHAAPWGELIDGRPRFDVEAGHTADRPRLRRINCPAEISDAFHEVMARAATVDMVADLIGSNVKFHHCKVNLKLPGTDTYVGYHQDFSYTPHTNDDIVTALLMLDDMTAENGCLMCVPGSHREEQLTLYDGDRFVGQTSREETVRLKARAVPVTGPAGGVCLMHTSLVHGSEANRSGAPRGLYICVYTAADAFPLSPNPLPNRFEGSILRGRPTRVARLTARRVELPSQGKVASFFSTQGQRSAAGD